MKACVCRGKRISRWSYGRWNEVVFAHPIAGRLGWFSRYFNIGPIEMGGHTTTVKQTTRTLRSVHALRGYTRKLG